MRLFLDYQYKFEYHSYKYNYDLEDIGEKIRLFYVALTRAKEKMIIVNCFDDKIEAWDFGPVVPKAYINYNVFGSCDIATFIDFEKSDSNDCIKVWRGVQCCWH